VRLSVIWHVIKPNKHKPLTFRVSIYKLYTHCVHDNVGWNPSYLQHVQLHPVKSTVSTSKDLTYECTAQDNSLTVSTAHKLTQVTTGIICSRNRAPGSMPPPIFHLVAYFYRCFTKFCKYFLANITKNVLTGCQIWQQKCTTFSLAGAALGLQYSSKPLDMLHGREGSTMAHWHKAAAPIFVPRRCQCMLPVLQYNYRCLCRWYQRAAKS